MAAAWSTRVVVAPRRCFVLLLLGPARTQAGPARLRGLHTACRCISSISGGPAKGAHSVWRTHGPMGHYSVRYSSSTIQMEAASSAAERAGTESVTMEGCATELGAGGGGHSTLGGGAGIDLGAAETLETLGDGAGGPGLEALAGTAEATMAELGLGANTPVGLLQNVLESLHLEMGLPWWGAIVTGTLLVRLLVFPLMVKGQREAAKLNNFAPQLMTLNKNMADSKKSGNQFEFSKAHAELTSFYKKHKINPLKCFLVPMVQMPIFLSFFMALRKMAELPVPSLTTGGTLWFPDLTLADPLYILPIASTLTMLAVLELGAESGVDNPNYRTMKNVFRVVPILILPVVASFPTAVFTYWLTSNVVSVLQVSVLRVASVRRVLAIPDRVRHAPADMPSQGFITSVKKNWNDAQEAHRIKERERFVKHRLDIAAKAPLRQTYTQNPLQQKEATITTMAAKSKPGVTGGVTGVKGRGKPWEDSLG